MTLFIICTTNAGGAIAACCNLLLLAAASIKVESSEMVESSSPVESAAASDGNGESKSWMDDYEEYHDDDMPDLFEPHGNNIGETAAPVIERCCATGDMVKLEVERQPTTIKTLALALSL